MKDVVGDGRQTFRLQHLRVAGAYRRHDAACGRHHVLVYGLCSCLQAFALLVETLFQNQ